MQRVWRWLRWPVTLVLMMGGAGVAWVAYESAGNGGWVILVVLAIGVLFYVPELIGLLLRIPRQFDDQHDPDAADEKMRR